MARKKKILVMCFGNTCRSPMIAALTARQLIQMNRFSGIEIQSAGYGEVASKGMPAAAEWWGLHVETDINPAGHTSRWVGDLDLSEFDQFICVDPKATEALKDRNVPEGVILTIDVPNPYKEGRAVEEGIPVYRDAYHAYVDYVVPQVVSHILAKLAA